MRRFASVAGRPRHLHGWRKDRPDHRDFKLAEPPAAAAIAPRSNLRALMPPVQDQGQIGSCTANTGCEQMEFPVGFGFSVPENMMSDDCARTGIVRLPRGTEDFDGGHAVTAVGHDDAMVIDGEAGALLCQNHWGEDWGIRGFFWLPYGFFDKGLADDPWTLRRAEV